MTVKLNENFLIHTMGDETILVPTAEAGFRGVVQCNKSVEVILRCLEKGTDEEGIVRALTERFDGDEAEIRADVSSVLSELRGIGALDE